MRFAARSQLLQAARKPQSPPYAPEKLLFARLMVLTIVSAEMAVGRYPFSMLLPRSSVVSVSSGPHTSLPSGSSPSSPSPFRFLRPTPSFPLAKSVRLVTQRPTAAPVACTALSGLQQSSKTDRRCRRGMPAALSIKCCR